MSILDYFIPDSGANLSSSVVSAYIRAYTDPGDVVLDPFTQSEAVVTETIAQGRSVIAINVNPLDILQVRGSLGQLWQDEVLAALTRLGDTSKSGTTMRRHISGLYRTACPLCAAEAVGEYFVWERDAQVPLQVRYHCPSCGASGMRHCDRADGEIATQIPTQGLHYWHIVDRVAKGHSDARQLVEELLELYTARNLYGLSVLLLKADDLFAGTPLRETFRWMLLHCLKRGSKLQSIPGEADVAQVTRLQPPARYAEWNIWYLLERAAQQLPKRPSTPAPMRDSIADVLGGPNGARDASAFVGHMSVRALVQTVGPESVRLIIGEPPTLGRIRWALPYLWTGCLYGHEHASALWPFVERRASYWWWYARAVQATLRALRNTISPDGRVVLFATQEDASFHEAVALAAAGAGWATESAVLHLSELAGATRPYASVAGDYRVTLLPRHIGPSWPVGAEAVMERLQDTAAEAAVQVLQERAEPVRFVRLHCGIWRALAQRGVLQRLMSLQEVAGTPLELARQQVRAGLNAHVGQTLAMLWAEEKEERCLWWLADDAATSPPLTERIEDAVQTVLASAPSLMRSDLLRQVYERFLGNLTPDAAWVEACIRSYAAESSPETWEMNPGDRPASRAEQRKNLVETLSQLGRRLGMTVRQGVGSIDVHWSSAEDSEWVFVVLQSATLSALVQVPASTSAARKYAVVAAARQDLIRTRLALSRVLAHKLIQQGWQLLAQSAVEQWRGQAEVSLRDIEYLVIQDLLEAYTRPTLPLL